MSRLPLNSVLGRLSITHVLAEYDGPILFLCRNGAGHRYLATWIESGEHEDVWLYVALSDRQAERVTAGVTGPYEAFRSSESRAVIEVTIPRDGSAVRVEHRPLETVSDAELPSRDLRNEPDLIENPPLSRGNHGASWVKPWLRGPALRIDVRKTSAKSASTPFAPRNRLAFGPHSHGLDPTSWIQ